MRYVLAVSALLMASCSNAQHATFVEEDSPRQFVVSGETPNACMFQSGRKLVKLKTLIGNAKTQIQEGRDVTVVAQKGTAYLCLTKAVDILNDQGFYAEIDEGLWRNSESVKVGQNWQASSETDHPEATPFDKSRNASDDLDAALDRAGKSGNYIILVMGANWCHDSRALAGWFATPRFARMLAKDYELVYIDVGYKDRNIDIAQGFGIESLKGTPTVLVVGDEAELLNHKTATTWRNAASRSEDDIFNYFTNFEPEF